MKKILLSLSVCCLAISSYAQMAVTGIAPASVVGNYTHSLGETSQSWGLALNFNTPGVFVQDTLAFVEDGSTGLNAQGNPISQEGCNTLTNASSIAGKIAVIYRNTCDFGVKAKNAQNAGAVAVIIVNRDPEAVGMNGGTVGATVTIPVVMMTSLDGALLKAAMETSPVVMFIGNKAGIFTNDLALSQEFVGVPAYHGVHSLLADGATDFSVSPGLRVFNYGSGAQIGATANVKIMGPSNTAVYDETVTFDLDGVTGVVIDSLEIFESEALSFPVFSLTTYPAGEYTMTYTLINGGAAVDGFPNDNTYTTTFVVNDTYISRARLNATTNKPIVTSMTRPAAAESGNPYNEVMYCSSFIHPNASRVAVTGIEAAVSVDSVNASSSINGKFVYADIYKWNNADAVYASTTAIPYDLESISSQEFSFENDDLRFDGFIPFENAQVLEDDQMYLFCLVDFGSNLNVGFDREVDFNVTSQLTEQWINPLKIVEGGTATWYGAGFGMDLTPSFGIRAINAGSVSVKEIAKLDGKVYPNPVSNTFNLVIPMDGKATVEITDLSGRTVATHAVDFLNNKASINSSELKNGMYVVSVAYDNGSKSTFNIVKN